MKCPKCDEKLTVEPYRKRTYNHCFYCEGCWVPKDDILKNSLINLGAPTAKTSSSQCPGCTDEVPLSVISVGECDVEYCTQCEGAYFAKGIVEKLHPKYKQMDFPRLLNDGVYVLYAIAPMTLVIVKFLKFKRK